MNNVAQTEWREAGASATGACAMHSGWLKLDGGLSGLSGSTGYSRQVAAGVDWG